MINCTFWRKSYKTPLYSTSQNFLYTYDIYRFVAEGVCYVICNSHNARYWIKRNGVFISTGLRNVTLMYISSVVYSAKMSEQLK